MPPPFGIGVGPPMTPFGLAYISLGLWNDSLMKSLDQVHEDWFPDTATIDPSEMPATEECDEIIEELLITSDEP